MARQKRSSINNYDPAMSGLEARALLTTFAFLPEFDRHNNFQVDMPEMRSGHSALIGRNSISAPMSSSGSESATHIGEHLDDSVRRQPLAHDFGSITDPNKLAFRSPSILLTKPAPWFNQSSNARPEFEIENSIEIDPRPAYSNNNLASVPIISVNKIAGSAVVQTNARTPDAAAIVPKLSIATNSFFSNAQSSSSNLDSSRPSPAPTNASASSLARPLVLRRMSESLSNPGNTIESDSNTDRRSGGDFQFVQLLNTSPNKNVPPSAVGYDAKTDASGDFISTSVSNQQWLQHADIKSSDISISTDTGTGVIQITSGSQSLTTVQWPVRSIVHNELTNPEIIRSDSIFDMAPELQLDAETLNSLMAEEIESGEMDLESAIDELLSQLSDHEISISIDSSSILSSASLLAVAFVAIESYRRTKPVESEYPKESKTSTQYMPEPVSSE